MDVSASALERAPLLDRRHENFIRTSGDRDPAIPSNPTAAQERDTSNSPSAPQDRGIPGTSTTTQHLDTQISPTASRDRATASTSTHDRIHSTTASEDCISIQPHIVPGLIGRETIPALRFDDTISRRHAVLTDEGRLYHISDKMPTTVNGRLLNTSLQLRPGDVVAFGMGHAKYIFSGSGLHHHLTVPRWIGRDHTASLAEDPGVEPTQAALDYHGQLTNYGTSFPTKLNSRELRPHESVQLRDGDVLQFGYHAGVYRYTPSGLTKFAGTDVNRFLIGNNQLHAENTPRHTMVNSQSLDQAVRVELRDGDIIRFGSGLQGFAYFKNGRLISLTQERGKVLQHLFPAGVSRASLRQGRLGDCGRLAALYALIHHNPTQILEMFDGNLGRIAITPRSDIYHPMVFTGDEIQRNGVFSNSLGINLLETAMGRFFTWGDKTPKQILQKGSYYHENFLPFVSDATKTKHVLAHYNSRWDYQDKLEDTLKEIQNDRRNKVGCLFFRESSSPEFVGMDPTGKRKPLYGQHMYTILGSEISQHTITGITLGDPHDTSRPLFVPWDSVKAEVEGISMADIR